jgi:hypothetical protein
MDRRFSFLIRLDLPEEDFWGVSGTSLLGSPFLSPVPCSQCCLFLSSHVILSEQSVVLKVRDLPVLS